MKNNPIGLTLAIILGISAGGYLPSNILTYIVFNIIRGIR